MTPTLHTPAFLLRPLAACDQALYLALYTDPDVMRNIAPAQDPDAARRDFQSTLRAVALPGTRRHFWILVEPGEEAGVGLIGIVRDTAGGCDLGIVMLSACQGRSYAAHAIAAVADHAFQDLGLALIRTRHTTANRRTEGLMHKLGFLPDAAEPVTGDLRWRLTPEHWRRHRGAWRPG
ncbi:GNAT family N-acetyltransferase [Arenimonas sp. MALMAid1274]|uniref:GNAT family N-acetyltransferase n=1 Tax=Arenimonas sp. MALMAid1274 TaxID=3411630 RepID=UPI003B9DC91F